MASYFMPSFFQKRLLKYVLSRVGLVETDSLDLDNLGISWGQRSVVELRDIGLKLEVSGSVDPEWAGQDQQSRWSGAG
jgi:autophagy-related protein 2